MKTYYRSIPEWDNPNDYQKVQIDANVNNPNTLEEKLETVYIKK